MAGERVRGDLISATVTEIIEGMGETALTPQEAMVVAELVLWNLMQNTMETLRNNDQLLSMAKQVCARVVLRLSSRVEAWPAKVEERS